MSVFPFPSFPSNVSTTFTQPGIKPVNNGKECVDLHGRNIPQGVHYVPGPDECTLCVCDAEGLPIWCKAVLCSPPQDCKSFRVGNSCCEFICLDDTINGGKGNGGPGNGGPFGPVDIAEVVPKIVIASVCSMLSLALLSFLVYRLRQRHIQGRINSAEACHSAQMCDECDDTRSLDFSNDCYFERPGMNNYFPPHYLASWKPPSSYFPPRGEAPPPYEEAIATTSNCLMQAPMASYMTMSTSNAFNPAAVNNTIILTNENINQSHEPSQGISQPVQFQPRVESQGVSHVIEGETETSLTPDPVSARDSSDTSCSSNPTESSKLENVNSSNKEPVAGPSSIHKPVVGSVTNRRHKHSHKNGTVDSKPENLPAVVCPNKNVVTAPFCSGDRDLPPYSARDCFRHSLTLPRHPRNILDLGLDLDTAYSQRHQQRYSLQFNVTDWSSSSSTLSLSTPNTPIGRLESLSSSTSSTSNNT